MKPGRDLDALVAEKVMGWLNNEKDTLAPGMWGIMDWRADGTPFLAANFPSYSTDITAAWEVVDRLSSDGSWVLHGQEGLGWEAELNYQNGRFLQNEDTVSIGRGNTAPHAICLAALKAEGIDLIP